MDVTHEMAVQDNPLWAYAARTIQAHQDGPGLKSLALRVHREPLRQYLAIRLGSEAEARKALAEISVAMERWKVDQLTGPPGPRARLFWLARSYVAKRGTLVAPHNGGNLAFQHGPQAAEALSHMSSSHAELLELRYARELSPVEIAYVLERDPAEVERQLHEAQHASSHALGLSHPDAVNKVAARTFALRSDPESETGQGSGQGLPKGAVIGERYTVETAVGVGAFGQVYRASDNLVPGHTVALKLLHYAAPDPVQRETALRELRLIASVFHPSIVSFKDHGWHEQRLWFVMPWYDGVSLEGRIAQAPLSRAEALHIFVPLASALASMHAVGVRHQDIKPDNIFLAELKTDPSGEDQLQPILLDLGVAATEAESIVAGTPAYFAPEVASTYLNAGDGSNLSGKADVFSLALALRNALEPDSLENVDGTALHAFILRRANQPPSPPLGKGLAFLRPHFARWLAIDPQARPSAAEFAQELQVLLEPERRAQRRTAFMSWFVPLMAVFLFVLAVGAFVWSQQQRDQERKMFQAKTVARNAQLSAAHEAELRQDLEATHEQLQDEHRRTRRSRDRLVAALNQTETEATELERRAAKLAQVRANTLESLEQTASELESATRKASELTTSKTDLEKQLQTSGQRVNELVSQSAELEKLLSETRQLLAREQSQASQLQKEMGRSEEKALALNEALLDQRDQARNDLQQAREQLQLARKQQQQTQQQLAALQARLEGTEAPPTEPAEAPPPPADPPADEDTPADSEDTPDPGNESSETDSPAPQTSPLSRDR